MTTSTRAVAVALFVDLVIGAAKLIAFLLTGSTAIMAEVLHSAADLTNQSLLAVGIARSRRKSSARGLRGAQRALLWNQGAEKA